jgi:alpha-1,2-mannosyltransferase
MTSLRSKFFTLFKHFDYRILILGVILIYFAIYWGNFHNFILDIDHCELTFCDFQKFYYPAGRAVLEQAPLPNGFYYSNFVALFFVPLALLPQPVSIFIWGVVQVAAAVALLLIPGAILLKDAASRRLYTFLLFTSAPLLNNFKWGQVSLLIVLGVLCAFILYARGHRFWSALLLGTLITVKFFPAVFLFYFLIRKDWKYLLVSMGTFLTTFFLIPMLVLGPARALQLQVNASGDAMQMVTSLAVKNTDTQYFASVIARYFKVPFDSVAFTLLTGLGIAFLLALLFLAYKTAWAGFDNAGLWVCALLLMTFPFWIPSAWPHYFLFLPLIQSMLFQKIRRPGLRGGKLLFILWLLSLLFACILSAQALQDWFTYVWMGLIFWSNLLTLIITWLALRHEFKRPFPAAV